jgi:uncharacterized repeat protein (TIGR01451 family)
VDIIIAQRANPGKNSLSHVLPSQHNISPQRGRKPEDVGYNWRAGLFAICLILLGSFFWTLPPATAQEPPDLSVEGSGGLAVPGDEVTYHIHLLNWTDSIVSDGVISHTLPTGFSYVPGSTQVTVGGWPITQTDPISNGATLTWGPFQLPAAGHTVHNPYGVHTFVQDLCLPEFIDFQLDQALELAGSGGYVTQLFYRITPATSGPDSCAVYFVNAAYDRNLVPILRLQGVWNPVGFWEKPDPGPNGDYAGIAAAFARYVDGLPRRNTHPLYVTIWNEPDLWVEWSGKPSAQEYGRFFVAVSNAIRGLNDPRIRVLNGAVTPTNTAFIRQLMSVPGFVTAFDAWASHCYPYNHPPWYNIHYGTARYGNAVIDCYIEERDAIARYGGRTGFKFVIKETGHGLGDDLYAFEGYSRINESNRANYISSAFKDFWRNWPEVIAVTPFELGDPWSGWEWLDWIDYTVNLDPIEFTYTPHRQFTTVAALNKRKGDLVPHGIEVTFRARVADDLPLGTYTSQLTGSGMGVTALLNQAAPVRVVANVERMYLPVVGANSPNKGVWYMRVPLDPSLPDHLSEDTADIPSNADAEHVKVAEGDGTIVPTHFLNADDSFLQGGSQAKWKLSQSFDKGEPHILALDEAWGRAYVGLTGGTLAVFDLERLEVKKRISLGADLITLAPGPRDGTLYGVLSTDEVVLIDAVDGKVTARTSGLGRPRGLVFDPQTGHLLVADAEEGLVARFKGDLSVRVATHPLDALPDRVLLDPSGRRLYVMLPGARRVLALDADTLLPVAEAELVGGPLIEIAFDAARGQLYVLSALSPRYRGISVLSAGDLSPLALVAGSPGTPLKQATALALSPDGSLLIAEGTRLYQISPEDFDVISETRLENSVGRGGLVADAAGNQALWLDLSGIFIADLGAP